MGSLENWTVSTLFPEIYCPFFIIITLLQLAEHITPVRPMLGFILSKARAPEANQARATNEAANAPKPDQHLYATSL
jgi:hypothetical protein